MMESCIQIFFIFLSCFYLYHKLLNIDRHPFRIELLCYIYFGVCSCLLWIISKNIYYIFYYPALIILFSVFIKMYTQTNYKTTLITTIIALGISLCSFTFSSVVIALFLLCTKLTPENNFWILIKLIIGIMQYLLVHVPFQLKRLKKGMPFLYELNFNNMGCQLSICIIVCAMIISTPFTIHTYIIMFCLLLFFPCTLLLISWWHAIITRNYRKTLQQFEMQKLKTELVQKEQEIARLLDNNHALAQIIHKDNKLVPAMELAVNTFLQNLHDLSPQQLKEQGLALATHLQQMTKERRFILTQYQTDGQPLSATGICAVDAVLQLMQQRALQEHIDYSLCIAKDIKNVAMHSVSEEDFSHLLADLIENAFIAMSDMPDKKILIGIGKMGNHLSVEISDNGQPFLPEIFQDFGLTPHTTHAKNGGSGIGLMDIWKLKKKYGASLVITEYVPASFTYIKQISLIFDANNHYIIQTYRKREIMQIRFRSDLYIFPYH